MHVWRRHSCKNTACAAQAKGPAPEFVSEVAWPLLTRPRFDVVVAGGTLGIFLAAALQLQGFQCASP